MLDYVEFISKQKSMLNAPAGYGKTHTITECLKQATRIQDTIKWFFGLGSSGILIGLFIDKNKILVEVDYQLFGIPVLLFLLSYTMASLSGLYNAYFSKSFLPNDSESIRETFNTLIIGNRVFIGIAGILLFLAMASFPAVIILGSKQSTPCKRLDEYFLKALHEEIYSKDSLKRNVHRISLNGFVPVSDTTILIRLQKGRDICNRITSETFPIIVNSDSTFGYIFQTANPITLDSTEILMVSITYQLHDTLKTLTSSSTQVKLIP